MTLIVERLSKSYPGGVKALDEVDLAADPGVIGVLGPNGAGKTTLVRTLATLLEPTSGRLSFNGLDIARDRVAIRRLLGYLPQKVGVYPRLSAYEHLLYFANLKGIRGHAARIESERLLDLVGLAEVTRRPAGSLSGGMRQRLGIAIALIGDPKLLVVDEPTAGLDPEERTRFRTLLGSLARDVTVVLSTHIVPDVEIGCSMVAVICRGRVRAFSPPEELIERVAGRVWEVCTDDAGLKDLQRRHVVMSARRIEGARVDVRLLADSAPDSALPARPRLEDAYVGLVREGGYR